MPLSELLAKISGLSRVDKLQLMQFLISDLAQEEGFTLGSESSSAFESLRTSHQGARQLAQFLEEQKQVQNV